MEPIDYEDFNLQRPRPGNPERLDRIRELSRGWRYYQELADIHREWTADDIAQARITGHSYSQLAEAAEISMPMAQRMANPKPKEERS